MIRVFNTAGVNVFCCDNEEALFKAICALENAKLLEDHPEFGKTEWSFAVYTPEQVASLYIHTKSPLRTPKLQEAYQKSLGLIEFYKGNYQQPTEIVVIPELDIAALKMQWCLDYCKAHHYELVDGTHLPPFSFAHNEKYKETGYEANLQ